MTHALKTWPEYFKAIMEGKKAFELRKADRDFKSGDILLLQEWDPSSERYTGKEWEGEITEVFDKVQGLKAGYVIFGIKKLERF